MRTTKNVMLISEGYNKQENPPVTKVPIEWIYIKINQGKTCIR